MGKDCLLEGIESDFERSSITLLENQARELVKELFNGTSANSEEWAGVTSIG